MKQALKYLLLGAALLLASTLKGQTIDELNAEIARAEREIAKNELLLKEVGKSKKSNQTQIKLLQARIDNREKIVASLNKQISLINKNINNKNTNIASLRKQIGQLEGEYAEMVKIAYKNYKLNNQLLFIFSADDFNTATKRLNFLRRYNERLAKTASDIDHLAATLSADVVELSLRQSELDKTKASHKNELGKLEKDKKELASAGKKLQAEEKKINKSLNAKREQKRKAQQALQRIINEEARRAKRNLTDQERRAIMEMSGRFDQNKGKMMLPVNGGVIIEHFGQHPHPTQRGLTVDNKGVNIAAQKGADVFAVFDGTVTRVMFINGLNNCVMLRHGDYFTIYSNLSTVNVRAGDSVSANRKLGNLSSGDDADEYQLHFELWYYTQNLNPEEWFAK